MQLRLSSLSLISNTITTDVRKHQGIYQPFTIVKKNDNFWVISATVWQLFHRAVQLR